MRKMKLHCAVEYLKTVDFYHDTFDLEDGLEPVLALYGIIDDFSREELMELSREVYDLAERNEFREAAILAVNDEYIEGMRMVNVW